MRGSRDNSPTLASAAVAPSDLLVDAPESRCTCHEEFGEGEEMTC